MIVRNISLAMLAALAVTAGANAAEYPKFPAESFRAKQPAAAASKDFRPPTPERFRFANGVELLLVERHDLPMVTMDLVWDGGIVSDPAGKEGLASLSMNLVTEGTETLDKVAWSEALADLGSSVNSFGGTENLGVSMQTLSKNLDRTLDLFAAAVRHPGLRDADLARIRKRMLASLRQAKGAPASASSRLTKSIVFGPENPYGRFTTEASLGAIGAADVRGFVTSSLRPEGAKLFVAGDIRRADLEAKFGKAFAGWSGKAAEVPAIPAATPRAGRIFVVDMPKAPQSSVTFLDAGPPRTAPDYVATSLLQEILGGNFSSRINMNIREKNGYAYGAFGAYTYYREGTVFSAGGGIRTDATAPAMREIWNELDAIRNDDVTPVELDREKNGAVLGLPALFDSAHSILGTYRDLMDFGLPLDYFASYPAKVRAVTAADVRKSANEHVRPDAVRVLVVGDAAKITPAIRELAASKGMKESDVVFLDVDGKATAAPAIPTGAAASAK